MDFIKMLRRLLIAASLFALPLSVTAELPALIQRTLLVGDPARTAAQISPDGRLLAYLAPDRRGLLTLWVKTLGKDDDRVATTELDRPMRIPNPVMPRTYAWQPDSKHLLFLLDHDGDEIEHLYQVSLESGRLRDLTPYKGVRVQGILGGQKHPDTLLIALNLRDRKVMDAYRLELDTGKLTEVARNPGDVAEWFGNNRGELVAAQAVDLEKATTELRVRDLEGDAWRTLATFRQEEVLGTTFSPHLVVGFSPDNRRIRLAHSEGAPASRLVEVDLKSGKSTTIAEDSSADLGGLLVNHRTGEVEAVWHWKERRTWTVLSDAVRADFDRLASAHSGDIVIDSRDAADRLWVVSFVNASEPAVYFLYDRDRREATRLFCTQPDLESRITAEVKPISLKARDGLALRGYLTLPPGIEPKELPLVVMVHGGPHLRDLWSMNGWTQLLANRGYAVLQVDFRGSAGYGKAHLRAGDRQWGGKILDDLIDAKNWAVGKGIARKDRCAIAGFSFGGNAALSALAFAPGEFVCGVAAAAPCDLVSLVKSLEPSWLTTRALVAYRLGDPDRDREALKAKSPVEHASAITSPVLLGHGKRDARVPVADASRLAEALKKGKAEFRYITFPSEGHSWMYAETRLKWAELVERFLAKHLGGRVEEPGIESLLPRFDGPEPVRLR